MAGSGGAAPSVVSAQTVIVRSKEVLTRYGASVGPPASAGPPNICTIGERFRAVGGEGSRCWGPNPRERNPVTDRGLHQGPIRPNGFGLAEVPPSPGFAWGVSRPAVRGTGAPHGSLPGPGPGIPSSEINGGVDPTERAVERARVVRH